MNRTLKLLTVLLLTPLALLHAADLSKASQPNILFIITDQQSYNMMSCMGNKWLSTPNMDKIAKMGYRFDKSYLYLKICDSNYIII